MPLKIIRADLTTLACDAIVNAANPSLLGGGGVDGAIHRAAGPKLLKACQKLGGCLPGEAKLTKGYDLPAKYIIHTVGPIWRGGTCGEAETLAACYRNSLELALERKCETVAFPLISAGAYGYPKEEALRIAVDQISDFLLTHEMDVTLTVYDRASFRLSQKLMSDVQSFIDEHYIAAHYIARPNNRPSADSAAYREDMDAFCAPAMPRPAMAPKPAKKQKASAPSALPSYSEDTAFGSASAMPHPAMAPRPAKEKREAARPGSLDDVLGMIDESFSQMLLRKIDEKGMTDAACYKKANVDRKLFSKIRSNPHYQPSKPTALAFAIALELDLAQTRELLMKAGFALSHSSKFDLIIEYFISKGIYDIYQINEALFAFDQSLLGA